MAYWEFLLQKDGDRAWLPLESPDVEILEGRYRIVARSNRVDTPVEVRVIFTAADGDPPKQRSQKRHARTNQDGLMVVIPFTRLKPGTWELRCSGDVMADMMGETWQTNVQLNVLPVESEVADDWDPTSHADQPNSTTYLSVVPESPAAHHPPQPAPPSIPQDPAQPIAAELPNDPELSSEPSPLSPSPMVADSVDPNSVEPTSPNCHPVSATSALDQPDSSRLAQSIVDSLFDDIDQAIDSHWDSSEFVPVSAESGHDSADSASGTGEPSQTDIAEPSEQTKPLPPLQITLDKTTYTAQHQQMLTVSGRLDCDESSSEAVRLPASVELCVNLQDPQTGEAIATQVQSLRGQSLPYSFAIDVELSQGRSHLLLGDVTLVHAATTLATQSFTVTLDMAELLETLAQETPLAAHIDAPLGVATTPTPPPDLTFLSLLSQTKSPNPVHASNYGPLPPLLSQPNATESASDKPKSLDLPAFGAKPLPTSQSSTIPEKSEDNNAGDRPSLTTSPEAPTESPIDQTSETAENGDQPELANPSSLTESLTESESSAAIVDSVLGEEEVQTWTVQSATQDNFQVSSTWQPRDSAFQSLNLQDRFLSRLSSLATDRELTNWLRSMPLPSALNKHSSPVSSLIRAHRSNPTDPDAALSDHEVVVEDDESSSPQEPSSQFSHGQGQFASSTNATSMPWPTLPEDEPIPTPSLQLTTRELIAGKTASLIVTLPKRQSRIWVKLWLQDRQTRTALTDPQWVNNFLLDVDGNLEARVQLQLPPDCLEIQVMAIAIELASQRQSNRATLERSLTPADLPALSFEDLDI